MKFTLQRVETGSVLGRYRVFQDGLEIGYIKRERSEPHPRGVWVAYTVTDVMLGQDVSKVIAASIVIEDAPAYAS